MSTIEAIKVPDIGDFKGVPHHRGDDQGSLVICVAGY